jgi:hypothetical protein
MANSNCDRYSIGNRYHCPPAKVRQWPRLFARVVGALTFAAVMAACLWVLNGGVK